MTKSERKQTMRPKRYFTFALLLLLGCSRPGTPPADVLFVGDHIITMDASTPTALAIRGETIVWAGASNDAEHLIGPDTLVVELGRRALLPGFIDAHGHLTYLASTVRWVNLAPPPVGPVASIKQLQHALNTHIKEQRIPTGEWVTGFGYDDSLIAERRHPNRDDLDAVSTDHPIALTHVSGHLAATNSLGLERIGAAAETPDPSGGHIRRRPNSREPNGVLEETATYPLRQEARVASTDFANDITLALDTYASHGVTSVQDGALDPATLPSLTRLDADGGLDLDVRVYPIVRSADAKLPDVQWREATSRLTVGGVKLVLDGSPQGKTAFLSRPYAVPPDGKAADYRGYPTFQQGAVDAMVQRFLGEGIPILSHANGDAAADMLIEAVAAAQPTPDHRTVMIHAQTVREDQLDRMAELGMVPSYFSAHTFFWGDWHRDSVLGVERASRISPTRSTVDRGMRFTVHNDAPIVPPDMIRLLWATTNRQTRSGQTLGADQKLTVLEALKAVTVDAAYQNFEEDRKGTLAVGKQADLVVLSEDLTTMDATRLQSVEVLETWSRGTRVFQLTENDK